jgi:hypothetical protein
MEACEEARGFLRPVFMFLNGSQPVLLINMNTLEDNMEDTLMGDGK